MWVDFAEEGGELVEGEVDLLGGELAAKGVENDSEELGDLVGAEGLLGAFLEVLRVFAFEEPSGGAPVAIVAGGVADGAEEFDFEVAFGLGDLVGEGGIAAGRASDRAGGATDIVGGDAAAASDGEEGEEALAFFEVEDGGTAGHGRALSCEL